MRSRSGWYRGMVPHILAAALLAGLAAWARHGFVESETLAPLCLEAAAPWWCGLRAAIEGFGRSPAIAVVALLLSLAAFRWRRLAGGGMGLGGIALAFGNLGVGGPAMVLGLLAAVRKQP